MTRTTTDAAVDMPDRWPPVPQSADVVRVSAPQLVPLVRSAMWPGVLAIVVTILASAWWIVAAIESLRDAALRRS